MKTINKLTRLNIALMVMFGFALAQGDNCGSIGNSNENELGVRRMRRLFLNAANPAPCNGNITSWRVCYYGPESFARNQSNSYSSTYAVYRLMGTQTDRDERYERVSDTFRAVITTSALALFDRGRTVIDGVVQEGGFTCFDDTNGLGMPLAVQAGDLVGACIFNPQDEDLFTREQLDIVGRVDGESLLNMATTGCTVDNIPSSIPTNRLTTRGSSRLHVYANIVSEAIQITTEATVATLPPTSTGVEVTTDSEASSTSFSPQTSAATTRKTDDPSDSTKNTTTNDAQETSAISHSPSTTASLSNSAQETSTATNSPSSTLQAGTQGRVAIVAAVSSTGATLLFLLTLVVTIVMLVFVSLKKCKHKTHNYTTNVAYNRRTSTIQSTTIIYTTSQINDYDVVMDKNDAYEEIETALDMRMEENAAYYKSPSVNPESESVYATAESVNPESESVYDTADCVDISVKDRLETSYEYYY